MPISSPLPNLLDQLRQWARERFMMGQTPVAPPDVETLDVQGPPTPEGILGAAEELGNIAKAVGVSGSRYLASLPANIAQATYNVAVPRLTGTEPIRAFGASEEPSTGLVENARQIANALTGRTSELAQTMLGGPYERVVQSYGREPTIEQRYIDAPLEVAKQVGGELTGITPAIEALTGRRGEETLSAREQGRRVVDAVLTLPIGLGLIGKAKALATAGQGARAYRALTSMADVDVAAVRRADIMRRLKNQEALKEVTVGGEIPTPPTSLTPEELGRITNTPKVLPVDEQLALLDSAIEGDVIEKVIESAKPGTRPFAIASEAIRKGGADPDLVRAIANLHAIPLDDAAKVVGDLLQESQTYGGKTLQAMSTLADEFTARALRGEANALRKLQRLNMTMQKAPSHQFALWNQAMNVLRPIENLRRALAVSQPATSARNFISQGATSINAVIEDTLTGIVEAATDAVSGRQLSQIGARFKRPGEYFADVMSDYDALLKTMTKEGRASLKTLLDEVPIENQRLYSSAYQDAQLLNRVRAAGGKTEWSEGLATAATTLNRISENQFRSLFFRAKLEQNMRAVGLSDQASIMEQLKLPRGERISGFDAAFTDAVDHGLKETFAFVPEAGFPRAMLDIYQKVPILTAIGPMYPRFWLNQYRWLFERSPLNLLDLFTPRFQQALTSGALEGSKIPGSLVAKQAARDVAKGMEGLALISAAWQLRHSDLAGPKYYHLNHPTDPSKVIDLRAYQPFVTLLGFAEKLKSMAEGKPFNTTPAEQTDLMLGVRRLQDTFLFSLVDLIRADDPKQQENMWKNLAGQWVGAFLVPGRAIQDFGAIANEGMGWVMEKLGATEVAASLRKDAKDLSTFRDIEDQPFLGPILTNIPGAAQLLPPRIDPFTSDPMMTQDPALRQLGVTIQRFTPLRRLVAETPGLTISGLRGEFNSQKANSLVSKYMGQVLTSPINDDGTETLGDLFSTDVIRHEDPKKQEELAREVFNRVRQQAHRLAEEEDPMAFIEYRMRQMLPQSEWDAARRVLIEEGLR